MSDIKKHLDIVCGTSSITVDRLRAPLYVPPPFNRIVARTRHGLVYLLIGGQVVELTTPVAVKVGLALAAAADECIHSGDVIQLRINGASLDLLPSPALQLGGVLAKKADRADDWQRGLT